MTLAVQECISTVATAYRGVGGGAATIVEAMLLENINSVC